MERKKFLTGGLAALGFAFVAPLVACKKIASDGTTTDGTSVSGSGSANTTITGDSANCTASPTETEGPFPTKVPASYVRSNITDGKTGYALTVKIQINSKSTCSGLANCLVDIWHCDADGNYSEYGGTGMQSTNYTTVHFLRGRQTTDSTGLVTFTTIFPGWYSGRSTHIHVHVYNSTGTSLLVTQIAFPETTGAAVFLVNGYQKGMSGYTYNNADNVFSDSYSTEIATVTGTLAAGFALSKVINV